MVVLDHASCTEQLPGADLSEMAEQLRIALDERVNSASEPKLTCGVLLCG